LFFVFLIDSKCNRMHQTRIKKVAISYSRTKKYEFSRRCHLLLIDLYLSKRNSTTVISCGLNGPRIISVYFFINARLWDWSTLRDPSTKFSNVITVVLDQERRQLTVGRVNGSLSATWLRAADVDIYLAVLVTLQPCERKKLKRTSLHRTEHPQKQLHWRVMQEGFTQLQAGQHYGPENLNNMSFKFNAVCLIYGIRKNKIPNRIEITSVYALITGSHSVGRGVCQ
jgi:hypothetical protein